MKNAGSVAAALVLCLLAGGLSNPVRRSPDLEARRRSAIDRNLIRFGRSYPAASSAAEIREVIQRPTRKGSSFLRFGRSQPITLSTDDLISLLRVYEDNYDNPESKQASSFMRTGRDPKFIRFGRSVDDETYAFEDNSELTSNTNPIRKSRGSDHFIRLGRDNEQINGNDIDDMNNERKKRSTSCKHC